MACDDVGIDEKTFMRWKESVVDKRHGPKTSPANKLSIDEIKEIILVSTSKENMNLPPSKIIPKLADEGRYIASESTFYRVFKVLDMCSHRGKMNPRSNVSPKALVATKVNQIYSWDITYLSSTISGKFYYLYLFMDIFSRKIVGQKVHHTEDMNHSSDLITEICVRENVVKDQLILHSDNGGPMKGATMLVTLQRLGVIPSFSRPKVSNDNPYSEALFKTLKYNPEYPVKPFASLEEAQQWVDSFTYWYNEVHLHSGINFVTPSSRHNGNDLIILEKRANVYKLARNKNPNRWSGKTRDWSSPIEVNLNYSGKKNERLLVA